MRLNVLASYLAAFGRAIAAAKHYEDLRCARTSRDGQAPADITRRIFEEFYAGGGDTVRVALAAGFRPMKPQRRVRAAHWSGLALCAGVLVAAASLAIRDAAAQDDGRDSLLGSGITGAEVVEPAAAVASEAPFQQLLQLECSDVDTQTICTASVPPAQAKQRLVLQFVSCDVGATGTIGAFVRVVDRNNDAVAGHLLAPTFASSTIATISQPMILVASTGHSLEVRVGERSGNVSHALCGVSGVRQELK
jgi:hypothetical protein